ncbi:hypothetical protein TNCV_4897381 [Trichonephila clavipes]|nr:hypothetical protein TNCV_4897381 [Trichonephila clavipes]
MDRQRLPATGPFPLPRRSLEGKSERGRSRVRIESEPKVLWLRNPIHMYMRVQPFTGSGQSNSNEISCHLSFEDTRLDEILKSFWEDEALPENTPIDDELKYCMEHLDTTHTRDSNDRYIVQMPIVKDTVQLGLSKNLAVKRLSSILIRCREFEPSTTEDPPCRAAMHVKSVES